MPRNQEIAEVFQHAQKFLSMKRWLEHLPLEFSQKR